SRLALSRRLKCPDRSDCMVVSTVAPNFEYTGSIPIPAIATRSAAVARAARQALRVSPGFLTVAIVGPRISGMTITPSSTTAAMAALIEKPLPRSLHSDNHSETDCAVQNDQRTQMTLKVASVFADRASLLRQFEERLPTIRSRPW